MNRFRDEAIVLRRSDFSETSQVASLLTADHGRRKVMAKGSRAERRKGQGARGLDLGARLSVTVYPRRGEALDLLGEWETIDFHGRFRARLATLYPALYLLEVAEIGCPLDEPVRPVHDALGRALAGLAGGGDWVVPFHAGLARLLAGLGYQLSTAACIACEGSLAGRGPVRFAPGEGGVLCAGCRPDVERWLPIQPGSAIVLDRLVADDVHRLRLSSGQVEEIWAVLRSMVREVTERRPRLEGEIDALHRRRARVAVRV